MTLVPRWLPRPRLLPDLPAEDRLFQVDADSRISAKCHWHTPAEQHPTLVILHGLEGCTDSHYMVGIAHKAWRARINIVRLNQRNCGGTEHLTPMLYNAGLSGDLHAVVTELADRDRLSNIWVTGFSMGGNLALKFAGEVGDTCPSLRGVLAVCPNIHPAVCVEALQQPKNWIYHQYFLPRLKARLQRKATHFPNRWDLSRLPGIRTMQEFDDVYTGPDGGYKDAVDYYERCGARHVLREIRVPTLIITAQDDPFIPFPTFKIDAIQSNPFIQLVAPETGGHCGFFQRRQPHEDGFWVENRIIEFITMHQESGASI